MLQKIARPVAVYQAFIEKYVKPAYLDSNKVVQLGVAESASQNTLTRAVLSRSGVLTGNGAVDSLVSFGLGVLDPTDATYSGSVGKSAGEAWNEPNPEQSKFRLELAQLIRKDIADSASFFKNAGDTYGVDYAYRYELGERVLWLTQAVIMGGSQGIFQFQMVLFHDGMDGDPYSTQFDNPSSDIGTECYGSLSYCRVETAAFAQRYLAIWSAEARGAAVFDAKSLKFVFKKFDLPRGDLLQSVAMTTDERHLLQQNSDGTFYVHRIADGETVLEGRIVDDEVIVWTPDMHFDSTTEGAHFVNLRFPGQIGQYTFQQFDSRLRVPGLVQKVLSGEYKPQTVAVGVPPRLSGTLNVADGRITGIVTPDSLGEMRGIRVYQDGILTDNVFAVSSGTEVKIDVARLPGARWVSVVALDEEGLVSLPVGRDLGADASLSKVRLLSVGVDQYDDERIQDLGLAVADAKTLADSLARLDGKTIQLAASDVLPDGEASPQAVLAAAEKLASEAQPGEQAVFFFAGHGAKGEDGRFYMATSNTDPENIAGTALSWDQLSAVLAKSKARMTVFIDACHSGAAGTDFFATNDDAVSGILKNIPSGLTVFSASKGRELSEENQKLGGGQFTQAVASVLSGDRAKFDLNRNGVIEVSELYVGVKRQVVERTEGRQTPWLARNQMVGDFALF
ncbi:MAG: caspase family protein [Nitratireductor sp.]